MSEDSFPASDPPSWSGAIVGPHKDPERDKHPDKDKRPDKKR
jgi:hypothetical protein